MGFKIGDRVKVRRDNKAGTVRGGNYYHEGMARFNGMEFTINSIEGDGSYELEGCPESNWTDEMLEAAGQEMTT